MLLQKTYRTDFRNKKYKINHGEIRQVYVESNHPSIIDRETFSLVQKELKRRADINTAASVGTEKLPPSPFSGIIICGICGGRFVRKRQKRGKSQTIIWGCNRYLTQGKAVCPSQKLPCAILEETTKKVLDAHEVTSELLNERLCRIEVPECNHLRYVFKDGSVKDILWEYPSRSLSWTDEMKEEARKRNLARFGKEKA